MENTSTKTDDDFFKEYLVCKTKKIRKMRNIKALLENKLTRVKRSVEETLENIKSEIFNDLEEILKIKRDSLEEIEKKIEHISSFLNEAYTNIPSAAENVSQIMDTILQDIQLTSYLYLDYIAEDTSEAKNSIGYIKSSLNKPEDLSLIINDDQTFEMGTEFVVWVRGERTWDPLMIHSLSGYAEDETGKRISADIMDKNDGSYVFLFQLSNYSKYLIDIKLYGRHIKDSPSMIEFECPDSEMQTNKNFKNKKLCISKSLSPEKGVIKEEKLSEEWCEEFNKEEPKAKPISTKISYNDSYSDIYHRENKMIGDHFDDDLSTDFVDKNNQNTHNKEDDECSEEYDEKSYASIKAHLMATIAEQCGVDLYYPIGVAVNRNDDIIICDTGHHRVWIIDESGKPKLVFGQAKRGVNLVRPSAVVTMGDGNFVIRDDICLHFYSHNGVFIRSIGQHVLNRPYGLAISEDEKLITLDETWKPTLYVFNKDGQVERGNLFEPLIDRPQKSKCRFMASYSNEVVVSDLGLSKMYKTTINGKSIKTFGCYGRKAGAMIEPSGIALDPNGTMLIGDSRNDRIQIFDWDGEYISRVAFSHLVHRPSDITLTKDGRLYVLNYLDHYLAIYRLKIEE